MKEIKYTCDNPDCKKTSENIRDWITIGSEKGYSLKIENNLPDRNLMSMSNHTDIHFCSAICFISRFVDKLKFSESETKLL